MFVYLVLCISVIGIEVNADGCCVLTGVVQPKETLSVADAFKRYGILDDYIPEPPTDLLVSKYGSLNIRLGTKMSPLRTLAPPYLEYPNATQDQLYSVFLVDIDATSAAEPTKKGFINGLFVNSPPNNLLQGDVIVPYTPAAPNLGIGYERFVGLLYMQKGHIDPIAPSLVSLSRDPRGFSPVKFTQEFNLDGPLAGNFFLAKYSACGIVFDPDLNK